MKKQMTYLWLLISTAVAANECSKDELLSCPTGAKSFECMDGCDCDATVLTCTKGYPLCIGSMILSPHSGPNITSISPEALAGICSKNIHAIIVRDFQNLQVIEPGFLKPISQLLEEIFIRNNEMLDKLDTSLFQEIFPRLKSLAVEYQPKINNFSFIRHDELHNLEELYLAFNNITELPCGLFDYLPNLKRIDLQGNRIVYVDECQFGPLSRLNPHLQVNLRDNPLHCNCSMLPLLIGNPVKFDLLEDEVKCSINVGIATGEGKIWVPINETIATAMGALYVGNDTEGCSDNVTEEARHSSRCACEKHVEPEICKPDCWWYKERPPCNNINKSEESKWFQWEGCACATVVPIFMMKIGSGDEQVCDERGQLIQHLSTRSWKAWLSFGGFLLVLSVCPLLFNAKKYCDEQKSSGPDGDDDSIDEEFMEYLLNRNESKHKTKKKSSPKATVSSKEKKKPSKKPTSADAVNIELKEVIKKSMASVNETSNPRDKQFNQNSSGDGDNNNNLNEVLVDVQSEYGMPVQEQKECWVNEEGINKEPQEMFDDNTDKVVVSGQAIEVEAKNHEGSQNNDMSRELSASIQQDRHITEKISLSGSHTSVADYPINQQDAYYTGQSEQHVGSTTDSNETFCTALEFQQM